MPPEAKLATIPDTDEFDALTDRELLLTMARDMRAIRGIAVDAAARVQPVMDKLANSPMFKLLKF